jgi:hypothetical protein
MVPNLTPFKHVRQVFVAKKQDKGTMRITVIYKENYVIRIN